MLQEQDINTGKCQTYCYEEHGSYTLLAVIVKQPAGYRYYWHHCDINSAPLEVTNAQGNTVWSGKYERFGFVRSSPLSFYSDPEREMESFEQNLRYAGQYFDTETGLHFNTFRFYDPQIGRFIMPDPIGLLGGINLYAYAPNPLVWIDPLGLSFGSGKGTHSARATLYDSSGNIKATGIWQRGNMTPSEAALDFPRSTLATHTEARITVDLKDIALSGDKLVIDGQYPPCNSCKGKMNVFAGETDASVVYNWGKGTEQQTWKATPKKQPSTTSKKC
ncbi:RHS repeat-associated core domain-containing protein [Providencia rettgeri]|uniref:RHS repeat-associated core domain-containing protein n=1 Tax=Proteus terrae TaxID=1574161 RepID=UPI00301C0EA6